MTVRFLLAAIVWLGAAGAEAQGAAPDSAGLRIHVEGAVNRPGAHTIPAGAGLKAALAAAGGLSFEAGATLEIRRSGYFGALVFDVGKVLQSTTDTRLRDGDRIVVASRFGPGSITVTVRGAVKRPGTYSMREGARLVDILALAEGFDVEADRSLTISPAGDGKPVVVDRRKLLSGVPETNSVLRDGDTVTVPAKPRRRSEPKLIRIAVP